MDKQKKKPAAVDEDFDVCSRCTGVIREGVPMYVMILCVPCWDRAVSRSQDMGYPGWQQQQPPWPQQQHLPWQQQQHRQPNGQIGHHVDGSHTQGPVRCSSPKLNFSTAKPHIREPVFAPIQPVDQPAIKLADQPLVKPAVQPGKFHKPRGRPPKDRSENKDKKALKHSKHDVKKDPPTQDTEAKSTTATPGDYPQKVEPSAELSPSESVKRQLEPESMLNSSSTNLAKLSDEASSVDGKGANQGIEEPPTQIAPGSIVIADEIKEPTPEGKEGATLVTLANGIEQSPESTVVSVEQSSTTVKPLVDSVKTELDSDCDVSSKRVMQEDFVKGRIKEENGNMDVKEELPDANIEEDDEGFHDDDGLVAMDINDDDVGAYETEMETVDEEENFQDEGSMRYFYCYFCVDDVLNDKLGKCEFCKPVPLTQKLCRYEEVAIRDQVNIFSKNYKEGSCVICFGGVLDPDKAVFSVCTACQKDIDKALG